MITDEYLWQLSQGPEVIHKNEIHIWRACLDQPPPVFHLLSQTLSSDERVRSERYYFERDQKRFITGRGILRMILSSYLRTKPGNIKFRYCSHGKPKLDEAIRINHLNFNVSHSAGLAIYAVVSEKAIGVDVEKIRPVPEAEQIALDLFSHWECEIFHLLPETAKLEAFFNCWTRKEAYLKARGGGLALALDQFAVSFIPGEAARLLRVGEDLQETTCWSISAFKPAPGYVAALAVQGCGWKITYWSWGMPQVAFGRYDPEDYDSGHPMGISIDAAGEIMNCRCRQQPTGQGAKNAVIDQIAYSSPGYLMLLNSDSNR